MRLGALIWVFLHATIAWPIDYDNQGRCAGVVIWEGKYKLATDEVEIVKNAWIDQGEAQCILNKADCPTGCIPVLFRAREEPKEHKQTPMLPLQEFPWWQFWK